MCRPAMDVSEICTGALAPALDGLAEDEQVKSEEGEKSKTVDTINTHIQRENITVKTDSQTVLKHRGTDCPLLQGLLFLMRHTALHV